MHCPLNISTIMGCIPPGLTSIMCPTCLSITPVINQVLLSHISSYNIYDGLLRNAYGLHISRNCPGNVVCIIHFVGHVYPDYVINSISISFTFKM